MLAVCVTFGGHAPWCQMRMACSCPRNMSSVRRGSANDVILLDTPSSSLRLPQSVSASISTTIPLSKCSDSFHQAIRRQRKRPLRITRRNRWTPLPCRRRHGSFSRFWKRRRRASRRKDPLITTTGAERVMSVLQARPRRTGNGATVLMPWLCRESSRL